jgi:CBS domain-containing protein
MISDLLNEPVSKFINRKMITISSDLTIQDAAKVMMESKVDSILVFEKNKVTGMVTERDILHDIVARGLDPSTTILKEIAKGPLITINKTSPVKEALEMMKKYDIRRLVVVDKRPIGLITQKIVCGNLSDKRVMLPELEIQDKTTCPYCFQNFEDSKVLGKHIDKIHIKS